MRAILLSSLIYIVFASATTWAGETAEASVPVSVEFDIENAAGETVREFVRGSTVRFVFRVHNAGDAPARLAFTFPPHRVAIVPTGGGEPVWQAFQGKMFMQVMQMKSIAPGETMEFAVEWGFTRAGELEKPVPAGEYRVQPAFNGFLQPGNRRLSPEFEARTLVLREDDAQ